MSSRGRRRGTRSVLPWHLLVLHAAGVVFAAAAWWWLVRGAIRLGREAGEGVDLAWLFVVLASAGAVACLLLALILLVRALALVGLVDGYRPRRARRR